MTSNIKTYIDPNASSNSSLVSFKGSSTTFDAGSFYCPYVPLGITGAVRGSLNGLMSGSYSYTAPAPERLVMEVRENQGGHFDAVAVFTLNGGRFADKATMENIVVWCIDHWGAPGLGAPARWKLDREIIFVHDPRLLVELKLHWHGISI